MMDAPLGRLDKTRPGSIFGRNNEVAFSIYQKTRLLLRKRQRFSQRLICRDLNASLLQTLG